MACVHVWGEWHVYMYGVNGMCTCMVVLYHVCVHVSMCVGCVLDVTLSEMQNPVYYVANTMVIVEVCISAMYKLTHH